MSPGQGITGRICFPLCTSVLPVVKLLGRCILAHGFIDSSAGGNRRTALLFRFFGIVDHVDHAASNREHQLRVAAVLKCDAHRCAFPDRSRAFRVGIVARSRFARFFLQDRLAASDLGDNGVELLAIFRDAAVSDVVAIPAGGRIEGIEFGQVDLRNASGQAVDEQPAPTLPLPARGVRTRVAVFCASFTRKTRRTTNRRSVNSCEVPVVYSLSRVSTNNGRIFKSSSFCPVAFGHLAEIHFPKVMTCGFATAAHSLATTQSMSKIGKNFRSMMEDWHERGNRGKDG